MSFAKLSPCHHEFKGGVEAGGVSFTHHSDFTGDVEIVVQAERQTRTAPIDTVNGVEVVGVVVPVEALLGIAQAIENGRYDFPRLNKDGSAYWTGLPYDEDHFNVCETGNDYIVFVGRPDEGMVLGFIETSREHTQQFLDNFQPESWFRIRAHCLEDAMERFHDVEDQARYFNNALGPVSEEEVLNIVRLPADQRPEFPPQQTPGKRGPAGGPPPSAKEISVEQSDAEENLCRWAKELSLMGVDHGTIFEQVTVALAELSEQS